MDRWSWKKWGPSNRTALSTKEHRHQIKRSVDHILPLLSLPFVLWTSLSEEESSWQMLVFLTKRTVRKGSEQKLESESVCGVRENCKIIHFDKMIVLMSVFHLQFLKLFYIERYLWGKCSLNSRKSTSIKKIQNHQKSNIPISKCLLCQS